LGQNPASARALLAMHSQLTFSVIPRLPYSLQTAEAANRAGVEVMLHLPMQPLEDGRHDVSSDEIREGMSGAQVSRAISRDLASVPYAAGVNNHMGSRATSDAALMSSVMMALGREHLYFVDSRTTPDSVALGVARRMGVPAFYRSVFLDDVRTVPYTLGQLRKLCAIAEREGAALAIGHPYPTTIAALRQFLPEFTWQGIELTPASHLVRMPGIARLAPPHSHSM
ncbi:MAG: divergent polysaccharide deacetylase family protein, partial [Terriglobia bacterium]